MRKDIKTNKVVKALALGLAATMAMTQPIEVMASTVSSGDSNDGGEGSATAENQQQENVTTVASAAQSANETIEAADNVVNALVGTVKDTVDGDGFNEENVEKAADDVITADGDAEREMEVASGKVEGIIPEEGELSLESLQNEAEDAEDSANKAMAQVSGAISGLEEAETAVEELVAGAETEIQEITAALSIDAANAALADFQTKVDAAKDAYEEKQEAYNAASQNMPISNECDS